MNKKHLTILRDALIEHAKNPGNLGFDLGPWADAPMEYYHEDAAQVVNDARLGKNYCGTTACAMGLATTIPAFKRLGLRFRGAMACHDVVLGQHTNGFAAAHALFDISFEDAAELFSSMNYSPRDQKDPLAVADKITALLHTA